MSAIADLDRELLLVVLQRHLRQLPTEAVIAISAAADELVDPRSVPDVMPVADDDVADLGVVVGQVRSRLEELVTTTFDPAEAMACARAIRHLVQAEEAIGSAPTS